MADCVSLPNAAELVEQLRHFATFYAEATKTDAKSDMDFQAADAIEQLIAENAKLKAELHDAELQHRTERCDAADYDCEELGKLRHEIDRLRHGKERLMDNLKAVLEEREENNDRD